MFKSIRVFIVCSTVALSVFAGANFAQAYTGWILVDIDVVGGSWICTYEKEGYIKRIEKGFGSGTCPAFL